MALRITKMNKTEIAALFDNVHRNTLAEWLRPIWEEINWRKGKQTFPPAKVKRILDFLGWSEE